MWFVDDIEDKVTSRKEGEGCVEQLLSKSSRALELWKERKIWLLHLTSWTFGLGAALMNAFVNAETKEAFGKDSADLGKSRLGVMTATTSLVAALTSLLLRYLMSHSGLRRTLGLSTGALGFLIVGTGVCITRRYYGEVRVLKDALVLLYIGQGVGRGVFESINKAVYADHFPTNKEGAFANLMMMCCLPYGIVFLFRTQATVQDWYVAIAVLVSALLIVPAYRLALRLDSTSAEQRTRKSKGQEEEAKSVTVAIKADVDALEEDDCIKESYEVVGRDGTDLETAAAAL